MPDTGPDTNPDVFARFPGQGVENFSCHTSTMDIRLLGDVEIESAGTTFGLDRSAERCVLATLALNAGRVVPLGTLVDNIWGSLPPTKAEETVASYVRAVRRMIERAGGTRESLPNRRRDGYRLDLDQRAVDQRRFVDLSSTARMLARRANSAQAIDAFERALRLWRGEALANVTGQWAESCRYRLRRDRLEITCELLDLLLRAGMYAAVAVRAADLVHEEPTERSVALAIRGLAGSGQQALIPSFMSRAAARMHEANGARPGAEIVDLARKLADSADADKRAFETPPGIASDGVITMTASNSKNVYQASGDQYFIG
jgi:DNA-binding SARP family transcriptional activator